MLAWERERPVGFALFFTTFSTFLTKPGLYLEDLFVIPVARGHGYGKDNTERATFTTLGLTFLARAIGWQRGGATA